MSNPALTEADWQAIEHVLLDLDGTLLDLDFDNHFWQVLVPRTWGEQRGLTLAAAQAELAPRFRACEGTLPWYSTGYWSGELGLDIPALKRQDAHRVRWLPGARRFLAAARARGKRLVLLTNSDLVALAIKDSRTGVLGHFDAAFSSQQLGAPKEDARFWQELGAREAWQPARSLFVDDTARVLRAAQRAGVRCVRAIRRPDSTGAAHGHEEFSAVDAIEELLGPA